MVKAFHALNAAHFYLPEAQNAEAVGEKRTVRPADTMISGEPRKPRI